MPFSVLRYSVDKVRQESESEVGNSAGKDIAGGI